MEKTPTWDFLTVTVCRIDPTETCFNWFTGNLSEEDLKSLEQNGILIPILLQVAVSYTHLTLPTSDLV